MKTIALFFASFLAVNFTAAQDASALLTKVYEKFNTVNTYQADAVIATDIKFLRILPQQAKIYYQKPDKFKVRSKGIAIVPRQNFEQLFQLLAKPGSYMSVYSGEEKTGSVNTSVVNVIPVSDTSDLILARVWVDPQQNLVMRSQLTTRSNGTVVLDYTYGTSASWALPDQIVFTVELKKFKIPRAVAADINTEVKRNASSDPKTGTIRISFSGYIINKALDPKVFR